MSPLHLLYHRVNSWQPDPWTLCVSPAHFEQQMGVVSRLSPKPMVTFDDGYADNLHHALPILEKYGINARFFIVSGALGARSEMWWDILEGIFFHNSEYDMAGYEQAFDRIRPLRSSQQQTEIAKLLEVHQLQPPTRPERRMLTETELCRLAASRCAEIGAHTVSHPVLSLLSVAEQQVEISASKRRLEEILGRPIAGFSYPNGMACDYTPETVEAVRRAGFQYAYSAFEHHNTDAWQLPRVMIRDWDADEFARTLVEAARYAGTSFVGI